MNGNPLFNPVDFSVIIPTYNRATLLNRTLESVLAQTFKDFEVIVVDDGSTDNTASVTASYQGKVRFFRQQNRGPGAARNLGAKHAAGRYLAFLDSDDLWFPWTLETYRRVIEQHQWPAFLAGKPLRFREEQEWLAAGQGEPRVLAFPDYLASSNEWRWWGASSFVIRRDAFLAAGEFTHESVNGEDADLALRLGTQPGFVQITEPATFAYREHEVSMMKHLPKTLMGIWLGVNNELAGNYPGGASRARERWQILTRQARPATFDCLRQGLRRDAWKLYLTLFRWHVILRRWKYLAGFPVKGCLSRFK